MSQVWLVDVDGTVALRDEAAVPPCRGPFDWDRVGEDLPNEPVLRVVRALLDADESVIFVSGRNEVCRRATWVWLELQLERGVVANQRMMNVLDLLMRPDTDEWRYAPDTKLKPWLYETRIQPYHEVVGVIDDRATVVRAWRELGLTCLQVAEGDF